MDRNSIIGIVLIAAVIITFGIATRPSKQEQEDQKRRRDSLIQVEQERIIEEAKRNLALDSVQKNIPENIVTEQVLTENETGQYGDFARSAAGEQEFYTIENNLLKLKLSTRGGRPYSVELKDYKTWDDQPLLLFDGDSTRFGLNFYSNNRSIATNNLFFQSTNNNKNIVIDRTPKSISMRLYAGEGNKHYIEYIYYLEPDSYKVGFQIKMEGMDQIMRSDSKIELDWEQKIRAAEKGRSNEIRYTNIFYKHFEDKVDKLGMRSKEENIPTKLKWVGFNQQFFSSVLIADNSFNNAQLKSEIIEYDSDYLKKFSAKISIPINGTDNQTLPMNFYYGPNHYKTLTTYGDDLNELVDLGWRFISWINKWFVINIFHFLEGKIASYG
ncbi:membrane protein insertase YidC, partial [Bacteroidota bacterium]